MRRPSLDVSDVKMLPDEKDKIGFRFVKGPKDRLLHLPPQSDIDKSSTSATRKSQWEDPREGLSRVFERDLTYPFYFVRVISFEGSKEVG
jgi:hypothetical protein